ncbi:hypothetical protein QQP08_011631 [Theobroma cacao]|nr:hypothetical protein QQP08_011631 [Theobroma cacao]
MVENLRFSQGPSKIFRGGLQLNLVTTSGGCSMVAVKSLLEGASGRGPFKPGRGGGIYQSTIPGHSFHGVFVTLMAAVDYRLTLFMLRCQ